MDSKDYNCNKEKDLQFCALCHTHFKEGDKVSIISQTNGLFLLAHAECISKYGLINDIKRRITVCETSLQIQDKLWRYMDLSKFIYMMKNGTLYFSTPSQFDDIYEGVHGELKNKQKWEDLYLSYFRASIITAPDNLWHKIDEKEIEKNAQRLLDEISYGKHNGVYINCWHHNEYESEAMWKMYSTSIENAIAIQTTYKKLQEEVGKNISIKPVHYMDYSKSFAGINEEYFFKRKAFEYEKEVRAILYDYDNEEDKGVEVKVNLNELIDNVYVSPYASSWLYEVVTDLIKKYGYTFKVHKSDMNETPF